MDIAKEEKNKLSNCINVFCDSLSEGLEPSIKNQKKIFCTFCGTELNPNSEICPKCIQVWMAKIVSALNVEDLTIFQHGTVYSAVLI